MNMLGIVALGEVLVKGGGGGGGGKWKIKFP